MRIGTLLAVGVLLLAPGLTFGQDGPTPACASTDQALPPEFAAWTTRAGLASATRRADLPAASLRVGVAANVALHPTPEVAYAVQPEKPGGSVSHGGMLEVRIARSGVYAVALGSGAWIDVLRDLKPVVSTAHGHGPACSSIRKVVDFPLTSGRYLIQISANAGAELPVMIVARP